MATTTNEEGVVQVQFLQKKIVLPIITIQKSELLGVKKAKGWVIYTPQDIAHWIEGPIMNGRWSILWQRQAWLQRDLAWTTSSTWYS